LRSSAVFFLALLSFVSAPVHRWLKRGAPAEPEADTRQTPQGARQPQRKRSPGSRPAVAWATQAPMRIELANASEHLGTILGLIEDAREWLWTKDTDQWASPWPTEAARNARVLKGLEGEKTWIVWDGDIPAATATITTQRNAAVWSRSTCTCDLGERAVFVHRLIVARKYAGRGLGAELIDWAGLRGQRLYGAKWIRIDVWSTNTDLHKYYQNKGFKPCGFCGDPAYPSGALFQKEVATITPPLQPQFAAAPDCQLAAGRALSAAFG